MSNLIDTVRWYSENVVDGRTKADIFEHMEDEFLELEEELLISEGLLNKPSGEDGIFGESIDMILCALDLIFKEKPGIKNDEIEAYVLKKLKKWKSKTEAGEYK